MYLSQDVLGKKSGNGAKKSHSPRFETEGQIKEQHDINILQNSWNNSFGTCTIYKKDIYHIPLSGAISQTPDSRLIIESFCREYTVEHVRKKFPQTNPSNITRNHIFEFTGSNFPVSHLM